MRQFYRDRLQRENKLDTGEDRTSQRMRGSQRLEHIVKASMRLNSNSRESERSQIDERGLSQSRCVIPTIQRSERARKG